MFERVRSSIRPDDKRPIVPLLVRDLPTVLPRDWTFMYGELAEAINAGPGLAWRVDGGSEYIIGGYWRRRPEIGSVEELHGRGNRRRLLAHLRQQLQEAGTTLLTLGTLEQERALGFYLGEGFGTIDEIVRYQKMGTETRHAEPTLSVRPLEPRDGDEVLDVDHAAFPWLWWNSAEEFDWYLPLPGVEAYVALAEQRVVAYAGFTISGRQGHLDRLAVHPDFQGQGYGKALVLCTLARMAERRVERVALTTQVDNRRSATLYAELGFVRTAVKYPIYGVWLNDAGDKA
ncbi:MAG: GNAT family N-acetyltransferase [Chloroflexota bacterium]